jgi:hypothetical protein
VHPGYSSVTIENDVAILWLPRSLRFSDRVRRINLPPEPALVGCQMPAYDEERLKQEREECSRLGAGFPEGLIYCVQYTIKYRKNSLTLVKFRYLAYPLRIVRLEGKGNNYKQIL